jgi:hypothetical protein
MQAINMSWFVQTLPSGGVEFQEQRQMLPILSIFLFSAGKMTMHLKQVFKLNCFWR